MVIKNESDVEPVSLPEGTRFVSDSGEVYESAQDVVVPAAHKMADDSLMAGEADVWVKAVEEGEGSVATEGAQYAIEGLTDEQAAQVYGVADALTLDKQNYQGLDASYIFDVQKEEYVETGRLDIPRWYPTLGERQRWQRAGRLRPRRARLDHRRQQRDVRDQQERVVRQARAQPVLPDLPAPVPARGRPAVLQRCQHRLRVGHRRTQARNLGPHRQLLPARGRAA
jgi:hypothetical protein